MLRTNSEITFPKGMNSMSRLCFVTIFVFVAICDSLYGPYSTEVLDANSTQLNAFSKLHCYESDAIIKSGLLIIIISRKPQTSTTRVEHD